MPRIAKIELETASPEVRAAVNAHLSQGYRLTNEKLTLLHNVPAFEALEVQSYAMDRELQRFVGKRAADFFEYAISSANECLVCSTYFKKLLKRNGIERVEGFEFTEEEKLLIAYGKAMAKNPKQVPDELFEALRQRFSEEALVVITTMGVFMIANNYFNDILQVKPEEI